MTTRMAVIKGASEFMLWLLLLIAVSSVVLGVIAGAVVNVIR